MVQMTAFREFEHDLNLVYRTLNTTDVTCTPGLNIEYVFVSNHSHTHHTHTGCSSPLVVWVQAKKDMVKLERAGSDGGEGRGGVVRLEVRLGEIRGESGGGEVRSQVPPQIIVMSVMIAGGVRASCGSARCGEVRWAVS